MRDIWAEPPGGPLEGSAPGKRSHLKAFIAAGLVTSLGLAGGGVLRWMGASTPVAGETVLAQFRAQSGSSDDEARSHTETARKDGPADQRKRQSGRGSATASSGDKEGSSSANAGRTTGSQPAATSGKRAGEGRRSSSEQPPRPPGRPEEGVYTWAVDGYERAPGTNRTLPKESHRVVTWEGRNQWVEHHVFSEQKETWFDLQFSDKGVSTTSSRNRVVMGPVTVDKTVVFNPPMFVGLAPFELGQTWAGSWRGKTSGEYKARTFEHTTLTIEGQKVEVWATEVRMTMRGEVEGTSIVRSWVAPDYNLVVKQYQDTRVTTGPGEYRSEWTGQVKSLTPQR